MMNNFVESFANKKLLTVFSDISNLNVIVENKSDIFSNIGSDEICFTFNKEKYVESGESTDVISLYLIDSLGNIVQVYNGGNMKSLENLIINVDNRVENYKNDLQKLINQKPAYNDIYDLENIINQKADYTDITNLQNQINELINKINNLPGCTCSPDVSTPEPEVFVWENIIQNSNKIEVGSKRTFNIDQGTLKTLPSNKTYSLAYDGISFIQNGSIQLTFLKNISSWAYECGTVTGTTTVSAYCGGNYLGYFTVSVVENSEPDNTSPEPATPTPNVTPIPTDEPSTSSPEPTLDTVIWQNIELNSASVKTQSTGNLINRGTLKMALSGTLLSFASKNLSFMQSGTPTLTFTLGTDCWTYSCNNVAGTVTVTAYYGGSTVLGSFEVTVVQDSIVTPNPTPTPEPATPIPTPTPTPEPATPEPEITGVIWENIGLNNIIEYVGSRKTFLINKGKIIPKDNVSTTVPFNDSAFSFEIITNDLDNITIQQGGECYVLKCGDIAGSATISVKYKEDIVGSFTIYIKKIIEWTNIEQNSVRISVGGNNSGYINKGQIIMISKLDSTISLNDVMLSNILPIAGTDIPVIETTPIASTTPTPNTSGTEIVPFNSSNLKFIVDGTLQLNIFKNTTYKCYSFTIVGGTNTTGKSTVDVFYEHDNVLFDDEFLGSFTVEVYDDVAESLSIQWINPASVPITKYLQNYTGAYSSTNINFNILQNGISLSTTLKNNYTVFSSTNGAIAKIVKPQNSSDSWTLQYGAQMGTATITCNYNGYEISQFNVTVVKSGETTSTTEIPEISTTYVP